MLELTCPHCQTQFAGIDKATNTCPQCNALFFTSDGEPLEIGDSRKEKPKLKREDVQPPKKMHVENTDKGLVISWRWFGCQTIFLVFFCIFWNGITWTITGSIFTTGEFEPVFILVPGIHVLVGFVVLYITLTQIFNRTTVIVSDNKIIVDTKPLPVFHAHQEFYADTIEQIYVKRNTHRSKNSTSYSYDVFVLEYEAEKPKRLTHTLQNSDYALFLEQEIESYLGIADRPIDEDFKR